MSTNDPVVEAVVHALWNAPNNAGCEFHGRRGVGFCDHCVGAMEDVRLDAMTAVAAARERIAADIEARRDESRGVLANVDFDMAAQAAFTVAASIARGAA